jgi:ATP:cob(I)alamin adenosyltransferase
MKGNEVKVTTKTGDKGQTSLYGGKRVRKDCLQIEILGCVDQLNAAVGIARNLIFSRKARGLLRGVQEALFLLSSELATPVRSLKLLEERVTADHIEKLEKFITRLERKSITSNCWLISENSVSANFNFSRTVARYVECRVIALKNKRKVKNPHIPVYLNRLSDLLYLLAVYYNTSEYYK